MISHRSRLEAPAISSEISMALSLQRYTWPPIPLKRRTYKEKEKSMVIALDKIDCYLPENLIAEILSRLPVKDLLLFRSVCKSWYDIISSPMFVSKHLNNYCNNNDNWRGCLLVQFRASKVDFELHELLVDDTPRVLDSVVLNNMPINNYYVEGPCNGLYYMHQYCSNHRALWNPAFNELKTLPRIIQKPDLPLDFNYSGHEVYGFGFDHASGDYKVVVMKGYYNVNDDLDLKHPVSVLVYSLRTGSWRYCGDLAKAYHLESNGCYIYVNGCCYWLGSYGDSSEVIISFNMASDLFKEIDVPDYAKPSFKCLAVYDDFLVFLSLTETDKILHIWTWSEEGCWTKKHTVGPFPRVRPIGHWGNRLVLQGCRRGKLLLYDPNTQEIKDLEFENWMSCQGVYAYMESLVSIRDRKKAGQQPEKN